MKIIASQSLKSDNPTPVSGKIVSIDPSSLGVADIYKLLIGSVVPRPIAFVSSMGADKSQNFAPFSFFNAVSSNPPCLVFAVSAKPNTKEPKDTLRNINETGEFVVNIVSEWFIEKVVGCAAEYPYGVSELEKVGLTARPSMKVKPPCVAESAVSFECKIVDTVQLGDGSPGSSTLVIGKIVFVHLWDRVYKEGKISIEDLKPVGRLGGIRYAHITEYFDIPVPKV